MGRLDDYELPHDSLLKVLQVWKYQGFRLTIRQAKWVSRLHRVIEDDVAMLADVSFCYADEEMVSPLDGDEFNSSRMDAFCFLPIGHSVLSVNRNFKRIKCIFNEIGGLLKIPDWRQGYCNYQL